ncbi:MAG TPA: sulfotransferase [Burkholderiales bacterium]|nr:sulfotransferase [Burkholderiales bacterium]
MIKHCFICSAARSGSTLLDMLLGGHPRAVSLGEFSFLGKALALEQDCSCGAPVTRCPAWTKIFEQIHRNRGIDLRRDAYALRQWDTRAATLIDKRQQTRLYLLGSKLRSLLCDVRYALPPGHALRLPLPPRLRQGVENAAYLYDTIAATWDKDLLVDSSKNVHKALAYYERVPLSTRVIFLTRDGRGVYFSRRGSGFSRELSMQAWQRYNERALRLLHHRVAPEALLQLKYEDLVGDVPGTLARLCAFLGLPFDRAMLDLGSGERHLFNGNDTRFSRERGIQRDERWVSGLRDEELAYFIQRGAILNARLGYGEAP